MSLTCQDDGEECELNPAQGGQGWILGKVFSCRGRMSTGKGSPGKWSWPQACQSSQTFRQRSQAHDVNFGLVCRVRSWIQ